MQAFLRSLLAISCTAVISQPVFAQVTYWNLFNIEGESNTLAAFITYATRDDMLNDENRVAQFIPDGFEDGSPGQNIVGTGADVPRAEFQVSKDFLDDNGSPVTVTLECDSGTVSPPIQVSETSPQILTVVGFNTGDYGSTNCTVSESGLPPDYFQVSASPGCQVTGVEDDGVYNCQFENATNRANFTVTKNFIDGNTAGVNIHIECTTGVPMMSDATLYEFHDIFDEIEFIVEDFDPYELDCTIYEEVPEGYSESYLVGWDGATGAFNVTPTADGSGCHFEEVASGDFFCEITNNLEQVAVTVDKVWIDDQAAVNGAFLFAGAKWHCDPVAILDDVQGRGRPGLTDNRGHLTFHGSPSEPWDYDTFWIYPHFEGSHCSIVELELDSDIFTDDSDCVDIEVLPGYDLGLEAGTDIPAESCTIINTRIYAGIPTLSGYGLALLALLMLGIGFVGFRRFS